MALYFLLGLSLLFALRTLVGWRKGMMLMIILAAIQDPIRKLVPGTPGWLVLVSAPIFIVTVFVCVSRTRRWWPGFKKSFPAIAVGLQLLVVLCLPAAVISATYGAGSWQLTLLGAFSYGLIFLAVITGYHYARNLGDIRKLLVFYCVVHGVLLTGSFLEYFKVLPNWSILGSAALGYDWIRWGSGYTVDMISGFYRSPDVMGWHAAAVSMLSLVLALTGKGIKRKVWIGVSMIALAALLLCGRRKMVYMLPVFVFALLWMYWQAGRKGSAAAILGILLIPAGSVWLIGDVLGGESANTRYYQGEGLSQSAMTSIEVQGFGSLATTYAQSGFFGEGLGTGTPGSHNLQVERPRVWQESTSSRILVELGVPGALGFLAVILAIVMGLWRETLRQLKLRAPEGQYAAGLVAFFLANVGSLTVSGQILADPFIASFLGFMVGLVLSFARLQPRGAGDESSASPVPAPAPQPGHWVPN